MDEAGRLGDIDDKALEAATPHHDDNSLLIST
jgi:hypothetical protein